MDRKSVLDSISKKERGLTGLFAFAKDFETAYPRYLKEVKAPGDQFLSLVEKARGITVLKERTAILHEAIGFGSKALTEGRSLYNVLKATPGLIEALCRGKPGANGKYEDPFFALIYGRGDPDSSEFAQRLSVLKKQNSSDADFLEYQKQLEALRQKEGDYIVYSEAYSLIKANAHFPITRLTADQQAFVSFVENANKDVVAFSNLVAQIRTLSSRYDGESLNPLLEQYPIAVGYSDSLEKINPKNVGELQFQEKKDRVEKAKTAIAAAINRYIDHIRAQKTSSAEFYARCLEKLPSDKLDPWLYLLSQENRDFLEEIYGVSSSGVLDDFKKFQSEIGAKKFPNNPEFKSVVSLWSRLTELDFALAKIKPAVVGEKALKDCKDRLKTLVRSCVDWIEKHFALHERFKGDAFFLAIQYDELCLLNASQVKTLSQKCQDYLSFLGNVGPRAKKLRYKAEVPLKGLDKVSQATQKTVVKDASKVLKEVGKKDLEKTYAQVASLIRQWKRKQAGYGFSNFMEGLGVGIKKGLRIALLATPFLLLGFFVYGMVSGVFDMWGHMNVAKNPELGFNAVLGGLFYGLAKSGAALSGLPFFAGYLYTGTISNPWVFGIAGPVLLLLSLFSGFAIPRYDGEGLSKVRWRVLKGTLILLILSPLGILITKASSFSVDAPIMGIGLGTQRLLELMIGKGFYLPDTFPSWIESPLLFNIFVFATLGAFLLALFLTLCLPRGDLDESDFCLTPFFKRLGFLYLPLFIFALNCIYIVWQYWGAWSANLGTFGNVLAIAAGILAAIFTTFFTFVGAPLYAAEMYTACPMNPLYIGVIGLAILVAAVILHIIARANGYEDDFIYRIALYALVFGGMGAFLLAPLVCSVGTAIILGGADSFMFGLSTYISLFVAGGFRVGQTGDSLALSNPIIGNILFYIGAAGFAGLLIYHITTEDYN